MAQHLKEPQPWLLDDTNTTWYIRSLGWEKASAENLIANCKKLYDDVEWDNVRDSILRSHKERSDGRSFFNDPETMQKEHSILQWDNRRMAPKMPEGTKRRMDFTDDTIPIDQLRNLVDIWKTVMVPSWTVLLTGPNTAHLDFNFVPCWIGYNTIEEKKTTRGLRELHRVVLHAGRQTRSQRYKQGIHSASRLPQATGRETHGKVYLLLPPLQEYTTLH